MITLTTMKNPYEIDKKGDIWCSNYPNVFNIDKIT